MVVMRGTIRRRGNAWTIQAYAGTDAASGRRRFATRTVHAPDTRAGRKEAERALAQLIVDVEHRRIPTTSDLTVAQLLTRWQTHAAEIKTWSPTTRSKVASAVDTYITPRIGTQPAHRITGADLDDLYTALLASGNATGGPLAPSTVAKVHAILRAAYGQAVRWGIVATNPTAAATAPTQARTVIHTPPAGALDQALELVAADTALAALLWLAASTGARRSQLVALRWNDLDLDTRQITFSGAVVDGGPAHGGIVVRDTTKTGRTWTITIGAAAVPAVRTHRARTVEASLAAGIRPAADAFMFARDAEGTAPWRPDYVTHRWARLRRQVPGLDGVRFHDLRHHVATQLLAAGMDPVTVAHRLGHSRPATTLNVYGHVVPERDEAAADLLDDVLTGR